MKLDPQQIVTEDCEDQHDHPPRMQHDKNQIWGAIVAAYQPPSPALAAASDDSPVMQGAPLVTELSPPAPTVLLDAIGTDVDSGEVGDLIIANTDSAPATLPNYDDAVARLSAMPPMEYDRLRKEEAKALGVQLKTLDDAVKAERNDGSATSRLPFPEVEAYPEPIDPAQLFDEVSDTIGRYIVLSKDQADAGALWVAHTYLVEAFDTSPLAIINAPERECAKTLLQTLLGRMSYRPLHAANASLSALFRSIGLWTPTIFIDEADTFFRDNSELHGMVNAGYKRGGFVLRSEAVGDSFEPRMFSVYCAKSIAGIALERHLPDSTMSRGIVFNMRRKLPHEKVERLRHADKDVFDAIASKLARFAEDYSQQVRLARPVLPDELSDRAQDNWEPLLAIAGCAGPEWVQRATAAALMLSGASEESVSTGNELLADIQHVFASKGIGKIRTTGLIEALVADDEKSWATYNRGNPLSPRQLAKQLAAYGIKSKTVRYGKETPKGYELSQFQDAFARYLAAPENLPQRRNDSPETMTTKAGCVADAESVAATENTNATPEPMPALACGGVAAFGADLVEVPEFPSGDLANINNDIF